ncbi:iron-containing alcohol dehydrogenase [Klebsiella pneumoniae]
MTLTPNPTEKNIDDGLALLAKSNADFVISFGGGSSHDTAKEGANKFLI